MSNELNTNALGGGISLLERRRAMMGVYKPYDAEVEYLQGSGTQYLDTGLYGNLDTKEEVSVNLSSLSCFVCGVRASNDNGITMFATSNGTQRFGNKSITQSWSANTNLLISINKDYFIYNGNSAILNTTTSFTTSDTIHLMWAGYQAQTTAIMKGKLYYAKIWSGGTLIFDGIPVRVGTTGYMYDKVSGQLFGNAGTGDFILGNDI